MPKLPRNLGRGLGIAWQASQRLFVIAVGLAIVNAVLPPLEIRISKHLVDVIALGDHGGIVPMIIALGVLFGGNHVLSGLRQNHQDVFARRVERQVMRSFLAKSATVDLGHFDDPEFHDGAARARREINWVPSQLTFMTLELVATSLGALGMIGVLAAIHPAIGGLLLACVAVWIVLQRGITRRLFQFHTAHTPAERERHYLSALLSEPGTAKEVRSFGIADHLLDRYTQLSDAHERQLRAIYRTAQLMSSIAAVFAAGAIATAYWLIADSGAARFTPGDFVAAFGGFAALASYAQMMSHQLGMLERHVTFLDDYFAFLDVQPLVPVSPTARKLPATLAPGLVVEGVRFKYPRGKSDALTGLDLEVHPGEVVALVGENGAGKTTIVNLLSRFYDPDQGRISMSGIDLRDLDPIDLRSRIGVLLQDFAKFELTVRDNVQLGRIDRPASDAELVDSLAAARAEFLLGSIAGGLDARVGRMFEGGHELSGGEWQRLAIARLMFRRADLWILDEPTSNLDPEAEAAIFVELKQQLAGRMAIVISHRFSTVRAADRIYVIADGRVLESGTHEALIAAGGRYAELFELQAAGYR